jgi:hypothetical protein
MLALAVVLPLSLVGGAARPHAVASRHALGASRRAAVCMYWHIFPRTNNPDGLRWDDPSRTSLDGTTSLIHDYNVEPGQTQALGFYDIQGYNAQGVDPQQCVVQVAEDGSCCYVYAQGSQPTGWRTNPNEAWTWMQPGQSTVLQSGWKVSLDMNNPEQAVYKFEKAGRFIVEEYLNAQAAKAVGQAPLPPGWITQSDPSSGQTYYYNQQTGATQWEAPQY